MTLLIDWCYIFCDNTSLQKSAELKKKADDLLFLFFDWYTFNALIDMFSIIKVWVMRPVVQLQTRDDLAVYPI